jgi:hypothetical protein
VPSVLAPLELNKQEVRNAVMHPLTFASAPATPVEGQMFYDTTNHQMRVWNGTGWDIGSGDVTAVNGTAPITASTVAGTATVGINAATGGAAGSFAAADYTLLHTATAAATVSALVQRDGSGNFAATTITASLTGTASNASALNNQTSAWHIARANHTGTQLAATISDLAGTVQAYSLSSFGAPSIDLAMGNHKITGLATPTLSTDAATKGYAEARANHTGTQVASTISDLATVVQAYALNLFAVPVLDLNLNAHKITGLATPTLATDAATKAYAEARANHTGSQTASTVSDLATVVKAYRLDEFAAPIADISHASHKIINLADPTLDTDAATRGWSKARANHTGTQLAATISDLATAVQAYRLDQFAVPTADISMASHKIINVTDPTGAQDAATKNYVDAVVNGMDPKGSTRAIATANVVTMSGAATIDTVSLIAGDLVLCVGQTTPVQNGPWVVNAGAWTRPANFSTNAQASPGSFWFVEEGSAGNVDTGWLLATNAPITLGTTPLTIVQFSGPGSMVAGNGLSRTGNTFSVLGTASRVAVSGSGVDIDAAYVGQTSITTLGTVATGTWNATAIALNKGGTGATTAPTARTALGAAAACAALAITGGAGTSYTVTHNLGTVNHVTIVVDSGNKVVLPDVTLGTNSDTVAFGAAQTGNNYTAMVIG